MNGLNLENQLDEKTKLLISKMEKELKSKDKEINDLKNELAYLKGQILNKNRKIFGQSSEQVDSNQISIFNEAEKNSDTKASEPKMKEIFYKRTKPSKNICGYIKQEFQKILLFYMTTKRHGLAHVRRKFHEIIVNLDKKALKKSRAIIGFNYCEKLYKIEKELKNAYSKDDDYYEKRYKIRLEKSSPIFNEFEAYVEREVKDALPRSPLGKALEYTRKLLPDMKILLEDGLLEI